MECQSFFIFKNAMCICINIQNREETCKSGVETATQGSLCQNAEIQLLRNVVPWSLSLCLDHHPLLKDILSLYIVWAGTAPVIKGSEMFFAEAAKLLQSVLYR